MTNVTSLNDIKTKKIIGDFHKQEVKFDSQKLKNALNEVLKIKGFDRIKFISKKFFFDLELIIIYSKKKLNIFSLKTNYSIPKNSSIKIFNVKKNIVILSELLKIILHYKKIS